MKKNPRLLINLAKIEANTRSIVEMCRTQGIKVFGVTKALCGDPKVGIAMLKGGAFGLADSRMDNIKALWEAGIRAPLMLLRNPMGAELEEVIRYCSFSLESEPEILSKLSGLALDRDWVHRVILMIDVGEIREGILPSNIFKIGRYIKNLPGLRVVGAGTNLSCYSGVKPTLKNMTILLKTAEELEAILGYKLEIITGGNSSSLDLIRDSTHPWGVNNLRIGESILLGHYISDGQPIKGTSQDALILKSELIEIKEKPSLPMGEVGKNVFGEYMEEEKMRIHYRAIAALGRQDVPPEAIYPLAGATHQVSIIGATSDHLLIDLGEEKNSYGVGSEIDFGLDYPGLLGAATSPYVSREYLE